ncbi:MAG: dienelactone hydrolase family protein [Actinomycetota bacterium]
MAEPSRRAILAGVASLPLARILADPGLAHAAAETTRPQQITTAGGRKVGAALGRPAQVPAPAVLLVHEWWGLNDQMRTMAAELATHGYMALAVDLFGGRVATTQEDAKRQIEAVDPVVAEDILASWLQWLGNHQDSNRSLATLGWCFGGGWALKAATFRPVDATVVYYGKVDLPAGQLERLKGPVMGHFGRRDTFVTPRVVDAFEQAMKQAGKPYQVFWYDAGHAFANPSGGTWDSDAAQLAWKRTLEFLGKELRTG